MPNAKEAFDYAQENYKKSIILTQTKNAEECRANILKAIYNGASVTICSSELSSKFIESLKEKNYKVTLDPGYGFGGYYKIEFK